MTFAWLASESLQTVNALATSKRVETLVRTKLIDFFIHWQRLRNNCANCANWHVQSLENCFTPCGSKWPTQTSTTAKNCLDSETAPLGLPSRHNYRHWTDKRWKWESRFCCCPSLSVACRRSLFWPQSPLSALNLLRFQLKVSYTVFNSPLSHKSETKVKTCFIVVISGFAMQLFRPLTLSTLWRGLEASYLSTSLDEMMMMPLKHHLESPWIEILPLSHQTLVPKSFQTEGSNHVLATTTCRRRWWTLVIA